MRVIGSIVKELWQKNDIGNDDIGNEYALLRILYVY